MSFAPKTPGPPRPNPHPIVLGAAEHARDTLAIAARQNTVCAHQIEQFSVCYSSVFVATELFNAASRHERWNTHECEDWFRSFEEFNASSDDHTSPRNITAANFMAMASGGTFEYEPYYSSIMTGLFMQPDTTIVCCIFTADFRDVHSDDLQEYTLAVVPLRTLFSTHKAAVDRIGVSTNITPLG
jgi:hypothetical protein